MEILACRRGSASLGFGVTPAKSVGVPAHSGVPPWPPGASLTPAATATLQYSSSPSARALSYRQASEDSVFCLEHPAPSSGFINATRPEVRLREHFLEGALPGAQAWARCPF